MNTLVICGDSFNYGIGCINLHTQPYGILTAEYFNWNLIRLARGSSSNYTTHLQGIYAADLEEKPYLIILGQTSYDRLEWVKEDTNYTHQHNLLNLNYHLYPPHHGVMPHHSSVMPFYIDGKGYNPFILSEQVGGIDDCILQREKRPDYRYYKRLDTEPTEKLKLIRDYYVKVFDYEIKKNYDIGTLVKTYYYIKRKGIHCIILTNDDKEFSKYVDVNDILYQNWGDLSLRYPDSIGSFHTSEEGHRETADRLIQKIKECNYG